MYNIVLTVGATQIVKGRLFRKDIPQVVGKEIYDIVKDDGHFSVLGVVESKVPKAEVKIAPTPSKIVQDAIVASTPIEASESKAEPVKIEEPAKVEIPASDPQQERLLRRRRNG